MYAYVRCHRGVVAAVFLGVVCAVFGSHCSHGVEAPRADGPRTGLETAKLDREAIEREVREAIEREARIEPARKRHTRDVLSAWEHDHPDKACPGTVDELNKYIGVSESPDLRSHPIQLWCNQEMLRGAPVITLMVEEDGGSWAPFDPGEIQDAAVRQLAGELRDRHYHVVTKVMLARYTFRAYPAWAADHPGKGCPDRLADLNEYTDSNDVNDAWGRPIKMLCDTGAQIHIGATAHIAFLSAGADGKEGTADDIKSRR